MTLIRFFPGFEFLFLVGSYFLHILGFEKGKWNHYSSNELFKEMMSRLSEETLAQKNHGNWDEYVIEYPL